MRARRSVGMGLTAAAVVLLASGCGSSGGGTAAGTAASTSVGAVPSESLASKSKAALVLGTSVTLTNATGRAVEVKPYSVSSGEGSYASLAVGASLSESAADSDGDNRVVFYLKRTDGGVVALLFQNPAVNYPYVRPCAADTLTGCDKLSAFSSEVRFSEGEQQEITATTSAGSVVLRASVTRGSDTSDDKVWTASVTSLG